MSIQNPTPTLPLLFNPKPSPQTHKSYLLKVDKQFLQELQSQGELIIEGRPEDEIILSSSSKMYKLKGINISTTLLVVSQAGVILQQTGSYLDVRRFAPYFQGVYQKVAKGSLGLPDFDIEKQGAEGLIENYGFTQSAIRKQCYLSQEDFERLWQAMKLVKIDDGENQCKYLYITLPFSLWIIRKIINIYNQSHKNLFQPIETSTLLQQIPLLTPEILSHISQTFHFQSSPSEISLTPSSIMHYIFREMSLAKKIYNAHTFQQVIDQMLVIYMPAGIEISSGLLRDRDRGNKEMEELYCIRYEYFIDVRGEKYVGYEYMAIETDIGARLKMLSGYKNRWNVAELRAIFRGVESTENGKHLPLADVLLKKFRKFGDEYEIKFILPQK